jgi:hypothetical protein
MSWRRRDVTDRTIHPPPSSWTRVYGPPRARKYLTMGAFGDDVGPSRNVAPSVGPGKGGTFPWGSTADYGTAAVHRQRNKMAGQGGS